MSGSRITRRSIYPAHRGVALLLVLAALVLAVTAAAGLMRSAATIQMRHQTHRRQIDADALLHAAEAPIQAWLSTRSSSVILPANATTPRVAVLDDQIIINDIVHELRITAWDQYGMTPVHLARSASPLRLALPETIAEHLDRLEPRRWRKAGLDQCADADGDEAVLFPRASTAAAVHLFAEDFGARVDSPADLRFPISGDGDALGAYIATHNTTAAGAPATINVATAPMPLVEAALRVAGRGGIEHITSARQQGAPIAVEELATQDADASGRPSKVRLVAQSSVWAMRIDCRVGAVRRSWWAVYTQSDSDWGCVQRVAVMR